MTRFRPLFFFVLFAALFTQYASADRIDFTVTLTNNQYYNPAFQSPNIPLGTTYTGYVTYAGSIDPNFTGYPPDVTSYYFSYPTAPVSMDQLTFTPFVQRHYIGGPLFVGIYFANLGVYAGSFDVIGDSFEVFTLLDPSGSHYPGEYGRVTYTYSADPPNVPEPASLWLIGTGSIALLGAVRRRPAAAS